MNSAGKIVSTLLLAAGICLSGSALAESNGNGNGNDGDRHGESDHRSDQAGANNGAHFDQHQRAVVLKHFANKKHQRKCPPGLAKKNNGCNPPGQVKQWQLGQQLSNDVIRDQLSPRLEQQLGQAPTGYRYARVDNDILLLELGSMIVFDMILGLGE